MADETTTTTAATEGVKTEATEAAKTETTVLGAKTEAEAGKTEATAKTEGEKTETKTDAKTEGEKKDDKAAATVDPKSFKLPDGFTADDKALTDFATIANEHKLPQDVAQKFLDMHATALKAASEASSKYWGDLQKEWGDAAKTTYGPEPAKNPKIIAVSKAIDSLGEKPAAALREALDMSGMGNHPAVVAAFVAFAERLSEPAHAKGNPPGRPASAAEAIYPNMKQG